MTNLKKFNTGKGFPLIVLAPLDWGLGHTTRCIPIIRELLNLSCMVVVACNEEQRKILKAEFPTLVFKYLRGYEVQYSTSRWKTLFSLIIQWPKIRKAIRAEQAWLEKFVSENKVDGVISDNRYGFHSKNIPSVIITHQLNLRTGLGKKIDKLASRRLQNFLRKFDQCWIPDNQAPDDIAGALSDSAMIPGKYAVNNGSLHKPRIQYLGPISRLTTGLSSVSRSSRSSATPLNTGNAPGNTVDTSGTTGYTPGNKSADTLPLIILSGPEPQRSILEKKIIRQAAHYKQSCLLIRGLPNATKDISTTYVQTINYADSNTLSKYIKQAPVVICRSGYSSVMDMGKLQKKMILIPTPGQGEQEYLGSYLQSKKIALNYSQENFDLAAALKEAEDFEFSRISFNKHSYAGIVAEFVRSLKPVIEE